MDVFVNSKEFRRIKGYKESLEFDIVKLALGQFYFLLLSWKAKFQKTLRAKNDQFMCFFSLVIIVPLWGKNFSKITSCNHSHINTEIRT